MSRSEDNLIYRVILYTQDTPEGKCVVITDDTRAGVVVNNAKRVFHACEAKRRAEPRLPVGRELKRIVNNTVYDMFKAPDERRAYEVIVMGIYRARQHGIESLENKARSRRTGVKVRKKPPRQQELSP